MHIIKLTQLRKTSLTTVFKQLAGNLSINKTDFESVKIEVMDTRSISEPETNSHSIIEKATGCKKPLQRKDNGRLYCLLKHNMI